MKHVQLNAIPLKDSTDHHLKTDRGQVSETGRHILGQLLLPLILRPGGGRGEEPIFVVSGRSAVPRSISPPELPPDISQV